MFILFIINRTPDAVVSYSFVSFTVLHRYSRNIEIYLYVFPFRVSFRIIIRGHKNVLKFTTVVFLHCRVTVQVASRHPLTTKTWIQSQYNSYGI